MASVTLRNISKSFGQYNVIDSVDLEIADGEFVVFVGPSGCGKSTLLRLIAGLTPASAGQVLIGGEEVTDVPPSKRGIAFVFQSYALYPHMNVARNIGFALETSGMTRAEIASRVGKIAEMLKIGHLLHRKPRQLSGGQRQRVAIGRALVGQPDVFLFDEPLSNLDADLRMEMRFEIAKLHDDLKATMIYVTHDQTEAMTLADRIVILNGGAVEQIGTPRELYDAPATRFVAGFLGSPRMNFAPVALDDEGLRGPGGFSLPFPAVEGVRPVEIGIRPEALQIATGGEGIDATFERTEDLGHEHLSYVRLEGGIIWVVRCNGSPSGHAPGDPVRLKWPSGDLYVFDAEGKRIEHRTARQELGV